MRHVHQPCTCAAQMDEGKQWRLKAWNGGSIEPSSLERMLWQPLYLSMCALSALRQASVYAVDPCNVCACMRACMHYADKQKGLHVAVPTSPADGCGDDFPDSCACVSC